MVVVLLLRTFKRTVPVAGQVFELQDSKNNTKMAEIEGIITLALKKLANTK
jgi:hypothetical protein